LALALDGGEWSASRAGRFIPGEIAPGTHWIRSTGIEAKETNFLTGVFGGTLTTRQAINDPLPFFQTHY
jgi:hypothetical protein